MSLSRIDKILFIAAIVLTIFLSPWAGIALVTAKFVVETA